MVVEVEVCVRFHEVVEVEVCVRFHENFDDAIA